MHLLRRSIGIIPQQPVVFSGTIRKNLDPFGNCSNDQLWKVLEEVKLKEQVEKLGKGLDTDMSVSSQVFSVGQK